MDGDLKIDVDFLTLASRREHNISVNQVTVKLCNIEFTSSIFVQGKSALVSGRSIRQIRLYLLRRI